HPACNEQACEQGKCERGPREGPWPSTSPNRRGRGNSGENEERVRGLSLRRRAYPLACSSRTNFAETTIHEQGPGVCRAPSWPPCEGPAGFIGSLAVVDAAGERVENVLDAGAVTGLVYSRGVELGRVAALADKVGHVGQGSAGRGVGAGGEVGDQTGELAGSVSDERRGRGGGEVGGYRDESGPFEAGADGIAEGGFVDGAPGDFLGETDVGGDAAEVDSADDADDLGGYGGPAAGVGGCGHRECTCDEA